jgi:hypothetical protein
MKIIGIIMSDNFISLKSLDKKTTKTNPATTNGIDEVKLEIPDAL